METTKIAVERLELARVAAAAGAEASQLTGWRIERRGTPLRKYFIYVDSHQRSYRSRVEVVAELLLSTPVKSRPPPAPKAAAPARAQTEKKRKRKTDAKYEQCAWACCDDCGKWRRVVQLPPKDAPWKCEDASWACDAPEEAMDDDEEWSVWAAAGKTDRLECSWVQCDRCQAWRRLPAPAGEDATTSSFELSGRWTCDMHPSASIASEGCSAPEEGLLAGEKVKHRTGASCGGGVALRVARVSVVFDGGTWHDGTVMQFYEGDERHLIKFDDGQQSWMDVRAEEEAGQLRWIVPTAGGDRRAESCARGEEEGAAEEEEDDDEDEEDEEQGEESPMALTGACEWVQCSECAKWRRLPRGFDAASLPDDWTCAAHPYELRRGRSGELPCNRPEDAVRRGEDDVRNLLARSPADQADADWQPPSEEESEDDDEEWRAGCEDEKSDERAARALRQLLVTVETAGGNAGMVAGWYTTNIVRRSGRTAGTNDTYYRTSTGQRMRSRAEVLRLLGLATMATTDEGEAAASAAADEQEDGVPQQAASMAIDTPSPRFRMHEKVRVQWPETVYTGRVVERRMELAGRGGAVAFRYRVAYLSESVTGGAMPSQHWHADGELVGPAHDDDDDEAACVTDEWEQVNLACRVSWQPLTDPAKAQGCEHRALCNYTALRGVAGKTKACPLCALPILRSREIVRDDAMRAALEGLPAAATTAWLRGDEAHATPLSTGGSAGSSSEHTLLRDVVDLVGDDDAEGVEDSTRVEDPMARCTRSHGTTKVKQEALPSAAAVPASAPATAQLHQTVVPQQPALPSRAAPSTAPPAPPPAAAPTPAAPLPAAPPPAAPPPAESTPAEPTGATVQQPAPPIAPPHGMVAVRAALEQLGMQQYAQAFEDEGFDSLAWLQRQTNERLQQIAQDYIKMRTGHQWRFVEEIKGVHV